MRNVLTTAAMLYAASASVALTPATMPAQQRLAQGDAVPRDFLVALLGMIPELSKSDFVIGALSPEVATKIELPPKARVLGTFVSEAFTVAIAEIGAAPDSVASQVRRSMSARGWTLNEAAPSGGGFAQQPTVNATAWCKGENIASVVVEPRPSTRGSLVRYVFSGRPGACGRTIYQRDGGSETSRFPTLYDPDDAQRDSDACRFEDMNGGTARTQTVYRSSLSLDEILAHYGKQLADSGWSSTLPGQSSSMVVGTWTKRDDPQRDRRLTLTISTLPGKRACRWIELGVQSFERR